MRQKLGLILALQMMLINVWQNITPVELNRLNRIVLKVIHIESFETLSEARQKEKYYKSTTGRRKLKEMLFEA